MSVSVRRATLDDVAFLAGLATDPDVAPYLAAVRASTPEAIADQIARADAEPDEFGVQVIEVDGERAGTFAWELVNRRSRIAVGERSWPSIPRSAGVESASRPRARCSGT